MMYVSETKTDIKETKQLLEAIEMEILRRIVWKNYQTGKERKHEVSHAETNGSKTIGWRNSSELNTPVVHEVEDGHGEDGMKI